MRWLLSGEGPTDIGTCLNAQGRCEGDDFGLGPMAVLLSHLAESVQGYAIADYRANLHFVSENALSERAKQQPARLQPARGKKKGAETSYFYGNALMMGRMAKEMEQDEIGAPVLAVLFRDTDGTRRSHAGLWADKWKSMFDGFEASGFAHGVPMLPKPKSEAWLLCAAEPALANCAVLEDLPGNDASPNSAKSRLDAALGEHYQAQALCDWLAEHPLELVRALQMPSFKAFHDAFIAALRAAIH